ncbi:hypothetical protein WOLCODRAFT_132332 [Wolfiporia cocos MD-104 SS10]|uniref:Nitrogen permease regulator 3 n=1 Tax=Wolfiporia cocos (strain MD-104) TaxID=742152 RepID=A0A2H3JJI0_WOLCO|nr:hypothetical protein WOLCODRAFT_132332 [Wolfiporia cocos MD-104 SS10]
MSETLIGILFVTSSAKGSSLVWRWPPNPESSPRLARPRPFHDVTCAHGDNPWRASNASENPSDEEKVCECASRWDDESYLWKRPNVVRQRSLSLSHSRSHPASRRASPSKDSSSSFTLEGTTESPIDDEYDSVLGYSAKFLAATLCPPSSMCHQRFGLVVDDLAFVGHPVCADSDGTWHFKTQPRGRGSQKGETPRLTQKSLTPDRREYNTRPLVSSWLQTFHFVLVLDRPDPSSSSSGIVWKYFDTIYEHIAFTMAAVLFQEQVLQNFVENECDELGSLKDDCSRRGDSFADYVSEALKTSSLAMSMKTLYDSIKTNSIAHLTINNLPLQLQLPQYLDSLLYPEDDCDADNADREDDYDLQSPSDESSRATKAPVLAPWKSLLRLDEEDERGYELYMKQRAPHLTVEDRELTEQLLKFLDLASVTLSLADMASLLDWDLESQVYPTVLWLVHHRRAKVVDIVHPGLKTVFAVPQKFQVPLSQLSTEFDGAFARADVPPLPKILSMISMATDQQQHSANHFYATVVGSKDLVPLYHDVVLWMLKRDLLLTLHRRIRIVATEELKERIRMKFEMTQARRERIRSLEAASSLDAPRGAGSGSGPGSSPGTAWLSLSPKTARKHARQISVGDAGTGGGRSASVMSDPVEKWAGTDGEDDFASSGAEDEDWYREDGNPYASMISDPARATRLERRWLAAMSEGKDPHIASRFERINQYFDGKCTDDEILFRAEITRKQLREVLHHYDEYLQTFLHPS